MNTYLVYLKDEFYIEDETTWKIIKSNNKKEAITKFKNYLSIRDDYFLDMIYGYYLTSDICENFFNTIAPEDSSNEVLNNIWKENVIKFFGSNKEWAELFIKSAFYREKIKFPDEMIFYIANNCWYDIKAIDINEPKFSI